MKQYLDVKKRFMRTMKCFTTLDKREDAFYKVMREITRQARDRRFAASGWEAIRLFPRNGLAEMANSGVAWSRVLPENQFSISYCELCNYASEHGW